MEEKTIIFKINKELKDRLQKKSKQYGLTISSYIKMLIKKDLDDD